MKKLFLLIIFLLIYSSSYSQIKQRASSTSVYLGIGYKFVYLTDPDASDAYPFFQLSNGDFLKEIDGFLGVIFNESYGIEFAPSYLFSNNSSSDGFYYNFNGQELFFLPVQTRLFAVPLNLRLKYYPFAKDYKSTFNKFYFGFGGGAIHVTEEITSQVYTDNTLSNYIRAVSGQNSFWTGDYEILVGTGSFSKIGFGFELSYRFVPLNVDENQPVISSIATNLNSVNLAINIVYGF